MALSVDGRKKVKTLKEEFKKEFGVSIRVYKGVKFADDDATLASIRKSDAPKTGSFEVHGNTKVGNVEKQFLEALGKLGLEEIPAENAPFDPNLHHAVMREDADGVEPDTVTAVFQKGYKIGDRVLRPAMVKVAN